jgi:N-acyl-D-aspartate/D-glutamate deacylase
MKNFVEASMFEGPSWADASRWCYDVQKAAYDWNSYAEYDRMLMKTGGMAINVVPFMGINAILYKVGFRETQKGRKLTPEEMKAAKEFIRRGMEEGALGVSISRDYAPGPHIDMDDLTELVQVAADCNGIYMPHVIHGCSPEGATEAIEIAKKTGIKLHLAHQGACPSRYYENTKPMHHVYGIIGRARDEGLEITFDSLQFPGEAYRVDCYLGRFFFRTCLRYAPEILKGADTVAKFTEKIEQDAEFRKEVRKAVLENAKKVARSYGGVIECHTDLIPVFGTGDKELDMKTMGQIGRKYGTDPKDVFFDIMFGISPIIPKGVKPFIVINNMGDRESIAEGNMHWLACPGVDVTATNIPELMFYPGDYGAMPNFYKVLRNRGVRVEEIIRKMTSFPAACLRLWDRGILRPGMSATFVIFDAREFEQGVSADYLHPRAWAEGIHYVIVNGQTVLANGKITGARPGRLLLRKP